MRSTNDMLTEEALRKFPKVELHRHLEGAYSLPTLHRMALRNGLPFPEDLQAFRSMVQFPADSEPDFITFLSLFRRDWYRSLEDVFEITAASVRELANDGIFYIELRFSPDHFAAHNGFDRAEVLQTVIAAADGEAEAAGIEIRYLIMFNRGKQTLAEMFRMYGLVRDLGLPSVVGVDLAGDETRFPPELFARFFAEVAADDLYGITIHAGEVTPATHIWTAIDQLHASRIGHGVAAIHDRDLQAALTDRGIVLEQCITSNYQTGAWKDEPTRSVGSTARASR